MKTCVSSIILLCSLIFILCVVVCDSHAGNGQKLDLSLFHGYEEFHSGRLGAEPLRRTGSRRGAKRKECEEAPSGGLRDGANDGEATAADGANDARPKCDGKRTSRRRGSRRRQGERENRRRNRPNKKQKKKENSNDKVEAEE